jgi:hypothetical protein
MDNIEKKIDSLAEKLTQHDHLFTEMFAFMRGRFEQIDSRFERIEAHLLRQDLNMEQWRSDCRVFTEGYKSNRDRIEKLENRAS